MLGQKIASLATSLLLVMTAPLFANDVKFPFEVGALPAGNYEAGKIRCGKTVRLTRSECTRLKFDLALFLGCEKFAKRFMSPDWKTIDNAKQLNKTSSRIYSSCVSAELGYRSVLNKLKYADWNTIGSALDEFYLATLTSRDGQPYVDDTLVDIGKKFDGHGRSATSSNIFGRIGLCPTYPEIRLHIPTKDGGRNWHPTEIRRLVPRPYFYLHKREYNTNKCLQKNVTYSVFVDGKQAYGNTFNYINVNAKNLMDKAGDKVVLYMAKLQAKGEKVDPYSLMENRELMSSIQKGTLKFSNIRPSEQLSLKQLFFIYHNKFYDTCIVPASKSTNGKLRTKALNAGLFGRVVTNVKKYRGRRLVKEEIVPKLDVQPTYVQQYVELSNQLRNDSRTLLLQGMFFGQIQKRIGKDVDILLKNYECFAGELNKFEENLSHFAGLPIKSFTAEDVRDAFVLK